MAKKDLTTAFFFVSRDGLGDRMKPFLKVKAERSETVTFCGFKELKGSVRDTTTGALAPVDMNNHDS